MSFERGAPLMTQPLHFEDLCPGDSWDSPWREISAEDVADFANLTGDHDPLHTDQLIDQESPFGGPVAHGLLGLSILAGLSSQHPAVATLALVSVREWTFLSPIFFGDSVRARTRVLSVVRHGRRAGRVTWVRELVNREGRVVQRGQFETLVATQARQQVANQARQQVSNRNHNATPVSETG